MKVSLLLISAFFSLHAQAEMNCDSYSSAILGTDVRYCVDRSTPDLPAAEGEPVVYFMHGTLGGATNWAYNGYEDSLKNLSDTQPLKPMTFVSFDTSAYSFFSDYPTDDPTDTSAAYETWFISEFIPYIESTLHVCRERKCRGIMGESMGGLGAIKTALRHPELFNTIAANSPALSPFKTQGCFFDWLNFFSGAPIGFFGGFYVTSIFFGIFPTDALFDANNPTHLVENYNSSYPFPNLYFDMGGEDFYGFNVGYGLLKNALDQRGFSYSTIFEQESSHDMWKRHASDDILFLQEHM